CSTFALPSFYNRSKRCSLRSLKLTLNVLPFVKPKPTLATNGLSGLTDRQDRIGVHAGASSITPGATASLPRCQNPPFPLRRFDGAHGRAEELVLVCLPSEFRSPSEHCTDL